MRGVFVGTGVWVTVGVVVKFEVGKGVAVGWRIISGKLRCGLVAVNTGSTSNTTVGVRVKEGRAVGSSGDSKSALIFTSGRKTAASRIRIATSPNTT